jgi:ferredoxin
VRSDDVKILIDSELCNGHGRCVELLPTVFEFDDAGFGRVRDDANVPDPKELERVMALCPELAISVADD